MHAVEYRLGAPVLILALLFYVCVSSSMGHESRQALVSFLVDFAHGGQSDDVIGRAMRALEDNEIRVRAPYRMLIMGRFALF